MTALEPWAEPRPVRLTADDFFRLAEAGAFQDIGRTELIDGVIVAMNAQLSRHARVKSFLFRRLADAVDAVMPGFETWSEASVRISPHMVPEPDILVTSFRAEDRAAVPVDTLALVVEVADATRGHDLGRKAAIYARAGVPEYWVADVNGRVIHQMWRPAGEAYTERREVAFGDRIAAATVDGLILGTDGL